MNVMNGIFVWLCVAAAAAILLTSVVAVAIDSRYGQKLPTRRAVAPAQVTRSLVFGGAIAIAALTLPNWPTILTVVVVLLAAAFMSGVVYIVAR